MSRQFLLLTYVGLAVLACGEKEGSLAPGAGGSNASGGASHAKGGTSATKGGAAAKGGSSAAKGGTTTAEGGASGGEGGSSDEVGGTGPSEGGSSSTETGECALTPTEESGWVDAAKNDCKIQGAWYSYNDCSTSPEDCTLDQVPAAGGDGFPNIGGKMCTSGTTVEIKKQYDTKWGAGIALNLNQPTDSDEKNPISALPHPLTGFSFTISGNTIPGEVRVIYPTLATEKTGHFKRISAAGDYTISFSDVEQGSWVAEEDRVDLVPGEIVAIQFQVAAADSATVPFDFCVENLKALY